MSASSHSRSNGSHHSHSSHNQDNRRGRGGKKKRVVPPPAGMTAADVRQKIAGLTFAERQRIKEYFLTGTFKEAAEKLDADPHTVSDTFYKVCGFFAVLIDDVEKTPQGVWQAG